MDYPGRSDHCLEHSRYRSSGQITCADYCQSVASKLAAVCLSKSRPRRALSSMSSAEEKQQRELTDLLASPHTNNVQVEDENKHVLNK